MPVIADVIASLEAKAGCRFARMTGSGATCFGLFETPQAAADAAEQIAKVQTGWWLYAGVLN